MFDEARIHLFRSGNDIMDTVLAGWWLYIVVYAYLLTTYPVSGIVLKSTLFLGIYLALRVLFSTKRVPGDVLAALVVLWALVETGIGLHQLLTGRSLHYRYPMTGTFLNPGPFGSMLATGQVSAVALWRKYDCKIGCEAIRKYLVPATASPADMRVDGHMEPCRHAGIRHHLIIYV